MMKIKIITVGKDDKGSFSEIKEDYANRLRAFVALEFIVVKEVSATHDDFDRIRIQEAEKILSVIPGMYYRIALDKSGVMKSSEAFAHQLESIRDFQGGKVAFIIGGPFGLADEIKENADAVLSLSSMTLTHQMVRLVLLEQLYRGFHILQGTQYHK